jgi:hypothetical protein
MDGGGALIQCLQCSIVYGGERRRRPPLREGKTRKRSGDSFPCTGGGSRGGRPVVRHKRTVVARLLWCDGERKGMRQMVLGWATWAELGWLPGLLPGDGGGLEDCVFKKGKRKENLHHQA